MGSYCHASLVGEGLWLAINQRWIFWESLPPEQQSLPDPTAQRGSAEIFILVTEVKRHGYTKLPNFTDQRVYQQNFTKSDYCKIKAWMEPQRQKLEEEGRRRGCEKQWKKKYQKKKNLLFTLSRVFLYPPASLRPEGKTVWDYKGKWRLKTELSSCPLWKGKFRKSSQPFSISLSVYEID